MNSRSSALWQYLEQSGALNGSTEDIIKAKQEYRKQYKRDWNKQSQNNKELRPKFSHEEYKQICIRAKLYGLHPTAYTKQLILSTQEEVTLIPNKEELLQILQYVSMATITISEADTKLHQLISKAETLLLQYLNIKQ